MLLGYNTNSLAHHDLIDAIDLVADIGYESIAITIDHRALNPMSRDISGQLLRVRAVLEEHGMRSVVETGARFLLDPKIKHEPTLVTADFEERSRRIDFLRRAVDIAKALESDCVSFWSGVLRDDVTDGATEDEAMDRLVGALREVVDYAAGQGVMLGFEPEPGMFVDSMKRYEQLLERVDAENFRLTLDVGHLHCQGEVPIAEEIRRWASKLVNVHIEDMRRGVHEHLMFGQGEIDFEPVIEALKQIDYQGGLHVELSRHSHEGPDAARRAYEFLNPLVN